MPRPRSRIFLLSHMRAYTSLAGHILGSHPQIDGYYEMHLSYEDVSALDRQLALYRQGDTLKPGSRYLFDKLLHDTYTLKPERLGRVGIKILIALAEPEHTIRSIVQLFAQKETGHPYAMPAEATNYYVARVRTLADFSRTCRWPYYYFDAELLPRAPERLLPVLSEWLELDSPLSERYRVFGHTGAAGRGDSSRRIHRGSIDRSKTDYSHVAIPGTLLNAARKAYDECRARIAAGAMDAMRA